MAPFVNLSDLKERLAPLFEKYEDAAVVFDADGTLWSHDVGCMVFDEAVREGLFREEALEPLCKEAEARGISAPVTNANEVARSLQQAWYSRAYNERAAAEMQVWAYVGFTEGEFRSLVNRALENGKHEETLHDTVVELARWVREQGRRACVVSASPLWVVEEAARVLGIPPREIAAGVPNTAESGGVRRIRAGMAAPLPYGPEKVRAGRALLGESRWLAAVGDSDFDLHMMAEAEIGVGIGNKAAMLEGLAALPHGLRLSLTSPRSS